MDGVIDMPTPGTPEVTSSSTPAMRGQRSSPALRCAAITVAAALSAGAFVAIGCHAPDPQAFDPRAFQVNERRAAREVPSYPMRPLPTTLESRFLDDRRPGSSTRPTTGPSTLSSTTPTMAPATGPSLGIEPQVRMTLQEIMQ